MPKSVLVAFPVEFTSQILAKNLMENGNIRGSFNIHYAEKMC